MSHADIEAWMREHLDGVEEREKVIEGRGDGYMLQLSAEWLDVENRTAAFRQATRIPLNQVDIMGRRLRVETDGIDMELKSL